jgi:GH15 family glucan-1,4-alpha-glucosidase
MSGQWKPQVLRDYALIADGERGALIGPHGDAVWMCLPRWDSPAVFASLIGGEGGYQVHPSGRYVWGGSYRPGSLVWRNRWVSETGIVECEDALALPADPTTAVMLRRITAVEGDAECEATLALRHDWSTAGPRDLTAGSDGAWRGRLGALELRWQGAAGALPEGSRGQDLTTRIRLAAGQSHDLVLTLGPRADGSPLDADAMWASTLAEWDRRVPPRTVGLADRDVRHSRAVLHGLTAGTGAMVAAATLGLPERAEQGRNYDYRYAWIRDQCYAGHAAAASGDNLLLDSAIRFVTARLHEDGPKLTPAYTTTGDPVPDEQELALPGYPGGRAVAGNGANDQFQLDAFGEALLLLARADARDRLDADSWQAALVAVDAIAQRWTDPDSGIWEIDPQPWTHSRLICAAGLRALARRPRAGPAAAGWESLADTIVADTAAHATHPSGRWQRSRTDTRVDASLLLPGLRGAVPAGDSRTAATLRAVLSDLTQDEYTYRFRHGDQELGRAEGAFLLCGYLTSLSLADAGDQAGALRLFERARCACGPPGLFAEEFDVEQRQLRGNLPQAFVHALLIETAHRLATSTLTPPTT